jgi:5'-phosphate synthase pdxT subunit
VRNPEDLVGVDRLILPGGESSTVGKLMDRFGLGVAIQQAAAQGMPVWGTCMGMILLASEVEDRDQYRLSLLDITVRRNAFGAQVHSFETELDMAGADGPVTGVFIRAPIVTRVGPDVQVVSEFEGQIVGVLQGRILGTSFHPELTDDPRCHEYFLSL